MTDEQFVDIKESLARLETNMQTLVGNGNPGMIQIMQEDIKDLQSSDAKRTGATAAFAFLITSWEFFKHFAQKF